MQPAQRSGSVRSLRLAGATRDFADAKGWVSAMRNLLRALPVHGLRLGIRCPPLFSLRAPPDLVWTGTRLISARARRTFAERIPFGVALALAIWIVWLYGPFEFPVG